MCVYINIYILYIPCGNVYRFNIGLDDNQTDNTLINLYKMKSCVKMRFILLQKGEDYVKGLRWQGRYSKGGDGGGLGGPKDGAM